VSHPVDPGFIPTTEQVQMKFMHQLFTSNVAEKVELELGFEAWLDNLVAERLNLPQPHPATGKSLKNWTIFA
jgi:hypothetical protein